jgi:hypothetical protein
VIENFEASTFSERTGETFRLRYDDGAALDVELVSVTVGASGAPHSRAPFSLIFRGALEPVLPQRIYRFEHDELGSFELFIVPIGPDGAGMQYQAVFG